MWMRWFIHRRIHAKKLVIKYKLRKFQKSKTKSMTP
jgi:hypothetical protein